VEIKSGLFEGDRIVTQRASQLYAQSLRGDSKSKDEKVDAVASVPNSTNGQIAWWVIILAGGIGGGGIVAAAFWLGRRSGTKMVILREPLSTSDRIER